MESSSKMEACMVEFERFPREARSRKRRAILCVDDEPRVLAALRRSLRHEPYEILASRGAEEALGVLERRPVEVVLSDERMAGMSGSELLYQVRELLPAVGRILLTGHPGPDVTVRSLVAGADVLMRKPWDEDALKRSIRGLLRSADKADAFDSKGPGEWRRDQDGEDA